MENKLTEGSNLRWESSRMILPEHKEAIIKHRHHLQIKTRPLFDEQFREELDKKLQDSMNYQQTVSIIVFGETEDTEINGVVTFIDVYLERVKIEFENGYEWIDFKEVVSVYAN